MKASGQMVNKMVEGNISGQMVKYILENIKMATYMDKEFAIISTEINIMVSLKMRKEMVWENIPLLMVKYTKDNFKII